MTHIESGRQGAKRQTWRDVNPRKLLREIIEDDPDGDEAAWREAFIKKIVDELDGIDLEGTYTGACVKYTLDNAILALAPTRKKSSKLVQKETMKEAIDKAQTKAQAILLLHLVMPNGKPLGQCTGADCKRFGGWYAKLGKLVPKGKTVAEVLSESKVRQLWQEAR